MIDVPVIWLMDSDFCENCGTMLDATDTDGLCWWCWENDVDTESDDEEYWDEEIG